MHKHKSIQPGAFSLLVSVCYDLRCTNYYLICYLGLVVCKFKHSLSLSTLFLHYSTESIVNKNTINGKKTKRHNIQLKFDNPENVVLVYTFLEVKNTNIFLIPIFDCVILTLMLH